MSVGEAPRPSASGTPGAPESRVAEPDVEGAPHPLQDEKSALISYEVSWQALGLPEPVSRQLIAHKCPYPSVTQVKMISETLKPHRPSGIIEAPTGTGKTIGFIATILAKLDYGLKKTQAVILSPTKILAEQISREFSRISKELGVTITLCLGQDAGFEFVPDSQIAVGTAAAFLNNYQSKKKRGPSGKPITVPARCSPDAIRTIVLDECDELFNNNNRNSVDNVFALIHPECQRILCSATIHSDVERSMSRAWLSADRQNFTARLELRIDRTVQLYVDCSQSPGDQDMRLKAFTELLELEIYGKGFQGIVFCERRADVDSLYQTIVKAGFTASRYHSEMPLEARDKEYDDFKHHRTSVLLTTNILARGIDIVSISMVVNYCPPRERAEGGSAFKDAPGESQAQRRFVASPATYVHRIGRGGRFGRPNVAITFCGSREELEQLAEIDRTVAKTYASQAGTLEQRLANEAVSNASVIHRVPVDGLGQAVTDYFENKKLEADIEDDILRNDRELVGNLKRNPELIAKIAQLREEKRRKREERAAAGRTGRRSHGRADAAGASATGAPATSTPAVTVSLSNTAGRSAQPPQQQAQPAQTEYAGLPSDFQFGFPRQPAAGPAQGQNACGDTPQLVD